jgi:DNA-binding transcriptional LysR family regulator
MNLQQLRYLCGIADHELNISRAAEALHTSQPGVTRQIRQLEEELRAELLVRRGNRIAALTEAGVPLPRLPAASSAISRISAAWERSMPMRTREL